MKTRNGFVSNSSSSSFIVVLDDSIRHMARYDWEVNVESDECGNRLSEEKKVPILTTLETGLGRATSICFGDDLLCYIEALEEGNYGYGLSDALRNAITQYGLSNILLLRESDEDMGGYLPPELKELTKKAIYEEEYH